MRSVLSTLLLAALLTSTVVFAKTKFGSVWKAPDAAQVSFAGKKVAALVIDKDMSLRQVGEDALVAELNARGITGVAAYRMIPKEELMSPDKGRAWFEKAGVEGVVAFRVITDEKRRTWQPSVWSSPYYSTFYGYYGYSWGAVYDPGYIRDDRVVSLETLIYSVPKNALIWAGVSETENPKKEAAKVVTEIVKEAVKEMKKQGLATKIK